MNRSVSTPNGSPQNGNGHNGVSHNGNGYNGTGQNGNGVHRPEGRMLYDPYVAGGSPIQLNGPFRTLKNIVVGDRSVPPNTGPKKKFRTAGIAAFWRTCW